MRRWLERLAMSAFVICAVLLWEGYKSAQRGDNGRLLLYWTSAALAIVLGVTGIRERHRSEKQRWSQDHDEQDERR